MACNLIILKIKTNLLNRTVKYNDNFLAILSLYLVILLNIVSFSLLIRTYYTTVTTDTYSIFMVVII